MDIVNDAFISVIIPVYNTEKYLAECVESVLNQTFTDYELILVDDGSTDGSGALCDSYAENDGRVKVIHKENGGASSARNAGLDIAKGNYIYFIDSDDHIEPEAFEKLITCAKESDADLVFYEADTFNDTGSNNAGGNYTHLGNYTPCSGLEMTARLLEKKQFRIVPWLYIFSRRLAVKSGIRFVEGIMFEDSVFTFNIFTLASKIAHLNETLYHRRYREGSVTLSTKAERRFDSTVKAFYGVEKIYNSLPEKQRFSSYIVRISFNAINCYQNLNSQQKSDRKDIYDSIKREILINGAYGDAALRARIHGKLAWAVVKGVQKIWG